MSGEVTRGRVYLVGAGPGDPELLTLKAVRILARADVVLHDDLVDRRVLAHARPDARIVAVGKRGGCRSTPQAFIERLIVREAMAGRIVVRLKGGDPMVFGRGGEELQAARAAGIRCEIVSGITAATASAAAAAISLTHRSLAPGVILVTGHEAQGRARVDWHALIATRMTLAIYMGASRAEPIGEALLAAGLARDTPVAIIERASTDAERVTFTTAQALARTVREHGIASPAIFVVGDVAAAQGTLTKESAPTVARSSARK